MVKEFYKELAILFVGILLGIHLYHLRNSLINTLRDILAELRGGRHDH